MTNIYQVEVYNYPTMYTVTGETKEEAIIKAREEYRQQVGYGLTNIRVYKTKVIYIEKC